MLTLGHLLLVVACSKRTPPPPIDPAELSTKLAAIAASGCSGLARALDVLSHENVHGRVLIELVDDVLAASRERCSSPSITQATAAAQLARARVSETTPAEALSMLTADEPAVHLRRAELLDQLGRTPEALRELDAAGALDEPAQAMRRLLAVSVAARAGTPVASLVAAAPITERTSLAFRAAADAPSAALGDLVRDAPAELATAIADRIERASGPAAARAARERAATAAPAIAEHWDALARAQIADGKLTEAVASWDRAIAIAPAQGSYRITPIQGLVLAGEPARARERAMALAAQARAGTDVELHVTAAAGAEAAGDRALAIALASEARALRPGDGRLAFELAQHHAGAGQRAAAAALYAELLACGAHGRPWHRHEVAAKLAELGDRAIVLAALDNKRACEPVDPADLATYVAAIRGKL